jgi:hypothetical protein
MSLGDSLNFPPKENDERDAYTYFLGSYFADEEYEGSKVIGRWVCNDFLPIKILGWTPRFSITSEHIAQMENGSFAVGRKGLSDSWYDVNATVIVFESFEEASMMLKMQVEIANKQSLWRAFTNFAIELIIPLIFVIVLFFIFI